MKIKTEEEEDQRKTSKMIAYLKVKAKIVNEKMQCFVKCVSKPILFIILDLPD